jgi:hypothetical protein
MKFLVTGSSYDTVNVRSVQGVGPALQEISAIGGPFSYHYEPLFAGRSWMYTCGTCMPLAVIPAMLVLHVTSPHFTYATVGTNTHPPMKCSPSKPAMRELFCTMFSICWGRNANSKNRLVVDLLKIGAIC